MKKLIALLAGLVVVVLLVFAFNYVSVGSKLATVIHDETRQQRYELFHKTPCLR